MESAPFSEYEKRFLLAEVIKAGLSLEQLLRIVKSENIVVNWEDICLPPARTVKSCSEVFNGLIEPPINGSFTQNVGFESAKNDYQASTSRKRRHSLIESPAQAVRRIQPKPAVSSDLGPAISATPTNRPKKRGRPSNAELQARKDEAALRGEVLSATPKRKPGRKPAGTVGVTTVVTSGAGPDVEVISEVDAESGAHKRRRGRRVSIKNFLNPETSEPGDVEHTEAQLHSDMHEDSSFKATQHNSEDEDEIEDDDENEDEDGNGSIPALTGTSSAADAEATSPKFPEISNPPS